MMYDAAVIGAGPAGLAAAAALSQSGLRVLGLAPGQQMDGTPWTAPWPNTYGIWADDLERLGLGHFLAQALDRYRLFWGRARDPLEPRVWAAG